MENLFELLDQRKKYQYDKKVLNTYKPSVIVGFKNFKVTYSTLNKITVAEI